MAQDVRARSRTHPRRTKSKASSTKGKMLSAENFERRTMLRSIALLALRMAASLAVQRAGLRAKSARGGLRGGRTARQSWREDGIPAVARERLFGRKSIEEVRVWGDGSRCKQLGADMRGACLDQI